MSQFKHIAFYRFCDLQNLDELRIVLFDQLKKLNLKGTILIAPEGINGMLAGESKAVDEFGRLIRDFTWPVDNQKAIKPFADMTLKESLHEKIPFRKTLVKIKKEILVFGDETIRPHESTATPVSPTELDLWMKESPENIVFLDTRNNYEVKLGKFRNTLESKIDHFRDFPKLVESWKKSKEGPLWADKKIVTYCTGGIRCEKASALMVREGFKNVYQLEGGILNYFEKTSAENFEGDCFVFDERLAVDKKLKQADVARCTRCLKSKPYDGTTNSIRDCHCAGEKKAPQFMERSL